MSWMSDNFDKVALGGGTVVALALAFFGWSAASGVDDELQNPATGRGDNNTAVPASEELPGVLSSMQAKHPWTRAEVDERPLDLFTGIALFARKGEKEPVDLWKDEPVHPPIPNRWFLGYRVDIGFADSPQRDPDHDGFSNLEEFQGKTDPSNPKSHPALIAKLSYADQDKVTWLLRWTSDINEKQNQFKFRDSRFPGKEFSMAAEKMAGPGDTLEFREADCPANGRFKLEKIEEREEMNDRLKIPEKRQYVTVVDLKPNKGKVKFEIPRRLPEANLPELIRYDRTAVFDLKAAGYEGKTFKVEEGTSFALPPDATDKNFFLKEVTDNSVTVEIREKPGQAASVAIPKGGFPDIKP